MNASSVQRTVLVVDDDPDIREVVGLMLQDEGYQVATAADGLQALDEVARHLPDVVLLDLWMPAMDGWTFQAHLRERSPETPVVVMTAGRGQEAEVDRRQVAGYLTKPFDIDSLLGAVERVTKR